MVPLAETVRMRKYPHQPLIRHTSDMEMTEQEIRQLIKALLDSQKLAALATQGGGQPYASLMAFAHTDDLHTILIATSKATHKFANIIAESRVALLIDNRTDQRPGDKTPCALTVQGKARQVLENEMELYRSCYLLRHPELAPFLTEPDTALLKITVHHYLLVRHFEQVMELRLESRPD